MFPAAWQKNSFQEGNVVIKRSNAHAMKKMRPATGS
jgi:hypothetical protein